MGVNGGGKKRRRMRRGGRLRGFEGGGMIGGCGRVGSLEGVSIGVDVG